VARNSLTRWSAWIGLFLLVVFVAIQFFGEERTNPPVGSEIQAPEDVQAILRRSCYDCHSNETRWPWYSRIAPVSWYTIEHVNHARSDLNFSEWPTFDPEEQEHLLEEIVEQVEKGEMPLASYLWIHQGARLSDEERARLMEWAGPGG